MFNYLQDIVEYKSKNKDVSLKLVHVEVKAYESRFSDSWGRAADMPTIKTAKSSW